MTLSIRILCLLTLLYAWPVMAPGPAGRIGVVAAARAQESVKVWVNPHSSVYHCFGSRYYGNTKAGQFMAEPEARASGNRPAYGQSCGTTNPNTPTVAPQPLRVTAPAGSNGGEVAEVRVWVNTRSGVYHCPGSRYYGNTKAGKFTSEAEARVAGNRPAYGRACG
jgi:hypothetical protein